MKIELDATRFSGGVGDFEIGHILTDAEGSEIEIVKFSGYSEIDETDGTEQETISVHFSDGSQMEFEDLDRAVFITRTYHPVAPDWFVIEVNGDTEATGRDRGTTQGEDRVGTQGESPVRTPSLQIKAQTPKPTR